MGFMDKIKNKMQTTGGKAKEGAGRATNDPYLKEKGQADQVSGDLKQAGEKVKDAFKD